MKTTLIAAALLLSGMAQAQLEPTDAESTFTLVGCGVSGKTILCTLTYTLTGMDKSSVMFRNPNIFTNDGDEVTTDKVLFAGRDWGLSTQLPNTLAYKNVPIKYVIDTQLPVTTTSIRALVLMNGAFRFDNIPVKRPAASVTPATAVVNSGLFNVQLSNCKSGAAGSYTCTGATVTPRK